MTADALPETGNRVVDAACASVADLSEVPLEEITDRLSQAHDQISSVLQHAPLVALPDRRTDRH